MSKRWAVCTVLFLLFTLGPASCIAAPEPVAEACDLGVLFSGAKSLDPGMPMPRALWGLVLYESFGYSLRLTLAETNLRDMPKGPEGQALARVCNAGWLVRDRQSGLRPMAPIRVSEAFSSLEAVRRTLSTASARQRAIAAPPGQIDKSGPLLTEALDKPPHLELAQGMAMLLEALRQIAPQPGIPSPTEAVDAYYRALPQALRGDSAGPSMLAGCCCGAALRNLERNLGKASGGTVLQMVSLNIAEMITEGHLATASVSRTADFRFGQVVSRSVAQDRLHLRLRPSGWAIYR